MFSDTQPELFSRLSTRWPAMKWIEKLFADDPALDEWMLALLKDFLAHEDLYAGRREWPVIHSVRALGEKRICVAVDDLIEICKRYNNEWESILLDAAMLALENMGPRAFEQIFKAVQEASDSDRKTTFLGMACHLGVKEDRMKSALVEAYDADPAYVSGSIAEYGDRDLLPFLYQKLEAILPELRKRMPARRFDCEELDLYIELRGAIIELEGEEEKRPHVSMLGMYRRKGKPIAEPDPRWEIEDRLYDETLVEFDKRIFGHEVELILFDDEEDQVPENQPFGIVLPFQREQPKVGRNDPCPCGSGKKFKKCCLENCTER